MSITRNSAIERQREMKKEGNRREESELEGEKAGERQSDGWKAELWEGEEVRGVLGCLQGV